MTSPLRIDKWLSYVLSEKICETTTRLQVGHTLSYLLYPIKIMTGCVSCLCSRVLVGSRMKSYCLRNLSSHFESRAELAGRHWRHQQDNSGGISSRNRPERSEGRSCLIDFKELEGDSAKAVIKALMSWSENSTPRLASRLRLASYHHGLR